MTMDIVSIIIPTYNRGKQVCNAIESAINQTYKKLDIIVIDDGSNDDTKSILERYRNQVKYFNIKRSGVSEARNYGIERCNGKYVAFLDSDDTWHKSKIKKQLDFFKKNEDFGMVLCDCYFVGKNRKSVIKSERRNDLKKDGMIIKDVLLNPTLIPSTALIKREVLDKVGWFDSNLDTAEDLDMHLRIATSYKIGLLEEALVYISTGNEGLSMLGKTYDDNIFVIERYLVNKNRYFPKRVKKKALFNVYISASKGKIWHKNVRDAVLYFGRAVSNITEVNQLKPISEAIYAFVIKLIKK
jgi:glycosyltransferase involved in cell wall biosynthesis